MCIEQNAPSDCALQTEMLWLLTPGNMGIGHDFDMFKQKTAAEKIKFVFIGGGTAHDELRSFFSDNFPICFSAVLSTFGSQGSTVSAGFSDNLSGSQCRCATGAK